MIVFSLERTAVRDVVMNGRTVIRDGKHAQSTEIVSRYSDVARRVASVQV
jgi:formimidoylglutamate deiminase